jgi:putative hydrolase of the HAD superfamily
MEELILENDDSFDSDFADFLIELSKSRSLIFDLDNTIYNEREFLFHAYRNISKWINDNFGCNEREVFNFLSNTFLLSGRRQIFDKLQSEFQIKEATFITTCLKVLRNTVVFPLIQPYPYFPKFIKKIKGNLVFIITNGTPDQQKNKIKSINWGIGCNKKVVYANLYLPKPSSESFLYLKKEYDLKQPIYIGNLPEDYLFAQNCGVDFIEVFKKKLWILEKLDEKR